MIEGFRIVDAHCHPIAENVDSLVNRYGSPVNSKDFFSEMRSFGLDFCCGSVIKSIPSPQDFSEFAACNEAGFQLEKEYPEFYQTGIRINPLFKKESVAEIEKYHKAGVTWIGELVPYMSGYRSYSSPEMLEILAVARDLGMTVNIHTIEDDDIDKLMANLPDLKVIAAHPGDCSQLIAHTEMLKRHKNLYWDISGTGLFRWGMLRYMVEQCGAEKILFGTDFPICNISMQIYGVLSERISDEAKAAIFSGNYDRLSGR